MASAAHDDDVLQVGEIEIRPSEGLVLAGPRVVPMSVRELGVLVALARRAGRIVGRRELYENVWGSTLRDGDRSIDVYVHKVRTKLEDALPGQRFIHTHVGFGYRFSAELSHTFHNQATGA
jgi:DNA-binding response OmpR family regulator